MPGIGFYVALDIVVVSNCSVELCMIFICKRVPPLVEAFVFEITDRSILFFFFKCRLSHFSFHRFPSRRLFLKKKKIIIIKKNEFFFLEFYLEGKFFVPH